MILNDACSGFIKRTSCLLLVITGMISGCQQHVQPKSVVSQSPSADVSSVPSPQLMTETKSPESVGGNSEGMASTCQQELLALSKVNQAAYAQRKASFDDLLASASVYTNVRGDIGEDTRTTMDALYKYKTQKLCSDIEQSVRQALINRGENFK
ncbi:hypothetical protein ACG0Z5_11095 [Scandinavium sp. M-37]|uniref:hypothetical protein n=1 Tax=Scandinavium sp. M-37 TaxID=3373077 RepID=UPI0037451525